MTDPTPDALLDEARDFADRFPDWILDRDLHGLSSLLSRLVARIEDLEARLPQQEKAR